VTSMMTQLNAPTDLHAINTGLESLTASFCAVQEENSTAKEILYLSVKKCLPVILEASPSKLGLEVLPNYVSLLKTGFLSLRKHVGKELLPHFKVSLQSTMSLFNADIFSVLTESAQGPRLLEDVIELFSEIVQDTSKVFESSLPELILFCENQMQNHILSVKARIYLFASITIHKYSHSYLLGPRISSSQTQILRVCLQNSFLPLAVFLWVDTESVFGDTHFVIPTQNKVRVAFSTAFDTRRRVAFRDVCPTHSNLGQSLLGVRNRVPFSIPLPPLASKRPILFVLETLFSTGSFRPFCRILFGYSGEWKP
jgi:hypothetical protein